MKQNMIITLQVLVNSNREPHEACRALEAWTALAPTVVRVRATGVTNLGEDDELTQTIKEGMARAFFASAWADLQEESEHGMNLSGQEIMNLIPATYDPAAWHAADTLHYDFVRQNRGQSLAQLYRYHQGGLSPRDWGHYAAMMAMGHGVGLSDYGINCGPTGLVVPYVEFGSHALEKDYIINHEG